MKKLICLAMSVMGVIISGQAFADDFKSVKTVGEGEGECALVEGSLDVLVEKAPATLVFEFPGTILASYRSKTKFTDIGPLMDSLASQGIGNWPEIEKSVREFAQDKISDEKLYKLYFDGSSPKYEMKIVFDRLCLGDTEKTVSLRAFGLGGAAFSGNFIVTEISTGKVCLNLRVNYAYSFSSMGYHFTANKRLEHTIGDFFFGKYLPAVYKKNK